MGLLAFDTHSSVEFYSQFLFLNINFKFLMKVNNKI